MKNWRCPESFGEWEKSMQYVQESGCETLVFLGPNRSKLRVDKMDNLYSMVWINDIERVKKGCVVQRKLWKSAEMKADWDSMAM